MDFANTMNFNGNYVLSNDDVQELIKKKIINPFVPQMPNGLTPIYVLKKEDMKAIPLAVGSVTFGEGGLGSGTMLPEEFGTIKEPTDLRKERRKQQLKNAQKKYRETHRQEYNKRQNDYYKQMKNDPERYERWKESMAVANSKYKSKKGYTSQINKKMKEANKEALELWKKENKPKRGRPKKGEERVEKKVDEAWIEMKAKEIFNEKMKEIQNVEGEIIKKEKKKSLTTGEMTYQYPDDINKANAVLQYPYEGDSEMGVLAKDYLEYAEKKKTKTKK